MTQATRDEDDSAVEQDADHPDDGVESDDGRREHGRASSDERGAGADGSDDAAHLADVEDGCGCAEVWEHLSRQRAADSD